MGVGSEDFGGGDGPTAGNGGSGAPGLSRPPFEDRVDLEFFCSTNANRQARRVVQEAITGLTPVTLLTGREGAGKSTLIEHLRHARSKGLQIGVLDPSEAPGPLFPRLLAAFGRDLPAEGPEAAQEAFLRLCVSGYEDGMASLLVVDDARGLSADELETLGRLISVREGVTCPLVYLLVGQPDLEGRLRGTALGARIGAVATLPPMTADETAGYVRHRLSVAGADTGLFDDAALETIHHRSGGLPGHVGAICREGLDTARAGHDREEAVLRTGDPSPAVAPRSPEGDRLPADVAAALRDVPRCTAAFVVGGLAAGTSDAEVAGPASALAAACLARSGEPVVAIAEDEVCFVDPARGVAVLGRRGLNVGLVRRALRSLPEDAAPAAWSPDDALGFAEPWRTALWRLAQVVDRTVSPRRLTLDAPEAPALLLADGRIGGPPGALEGLGEVLRRAAPGSGGSLRFALEPAGGPFEEAVGAVELLERAGGITRSETKEVTLAPDGWPIEMPRGLGFASLVLGAGIARGFRGADAAASVVGMAGAIQRRVARREGFGRVVIDTVWLADRVREARPAAPAEPTPSARPTEAALVGGPR